MSDLRILAMTKAYSQSGENGSFAIRGVSIDIREGESFAILGPSGSGKTTLLKLVAGLLQPDEGKIILGDTDVSSIPAERRGFGMVFQQPLLFPHMTVIENVAFGLKMQGIGKRDRIARAVEMLSAVGLSGYERRFPNELSGGQQQRVSLARAIVSRPRLLLLDEPFSALDPGIRGEMRELVKEIHQKFRITMLFVTHDRDEAFELADRVGVMIHGEIVQSGTPNEVYRRPDSPEVAAFIGSGNVWEGVIEDGIFMLGELRIPIGDRSSGPGWLVVRPELFRVMSDPMYRSLNNDDPLSTHLEGQIEKISFRQGFHQLSVGIGGYRVEVLEKSDGYFDPKVGMTVALELNTSQVHFIPKCI